MKLFSILEDGLGLSVFSLSLVSLSVFSLSVVELCMKTFVISFHIICMNETWRCQQYFIFFCHCSGFIWCHFPSMSLLEKKNVRNEAELQHLNFGCCIFEVFLEEQCKVGRSGVRLNSKHVTAFPPLKFFPYSVWAQLP